MVRNACTDSHVLENVHLITTDQSRSTSRFMNSWLLVGDVDVTDDREVLNNSKCDEKDQWVT